ncbi:MAG: sigma 54-interacting transcriptional regulator [Bradymonadales bacterium]|jgi:transcriptional regulator with GAF, ATPase, and Fis domain
MSENTLTQTIVGDAVTSLKLIQYTLSYGENGSKTQSFKKRLIYIGSHPDCDLCIAHASVSRNHAKIEVDENGYRLVDLDSKNGTFIADLRINDVYLSSGTNFRCGAVNIRFTLGKDVIELAISNSNKFGNMLGQSLAMREIFGLLQKVAPTPATVLVEGESGCGKELVAQAVHMHSPRNNKAFVIFDCSAVSKDLIESELFGHVKGAFTGAVSDRKGAFAQADGGTLFLDEIGELALDLQPVLLRVLENQEIRPVGSDRAQKVNVRVIAATNRSLQQEVRDGNFREDLFYRLAVIRVQIPPLRNRTEDIPLLVEHFLQIAAKNFQKPEMHVSFSTIQKLKSYRWPGNVRELRNYIERAALLSAQDRIETRFLAPEPNLRDNSVDLDPQVRDELIENAIEVQTPYKEIKQEILESFELRYWTKLLEKTKGNVTKAASLASLHRKSVEYILRKLDLNRDDIANS